MIKKVKKKKNSNIYIKHNSAYIKEIERIKQRFQIELEQIKENYDNKILYLENTIEKQKNQLSLTQNKDFDMVEKQKEITEKVKKELKDTIYYYDNFYGGRNNDMS